MSLVRSGIPIDATQRRFPSGAACTSIYSRVVNAQQSLGDILREAFPRWVEWEAELQALFGAYVEAKQAQHILDFDDLLLYWDAMLGDAALAGEASTLFDHVLVDEYQDTNRLQGSILTRLKPDGCGVTVVGDDAQAIYGFRAADVRNILDFPAQFTPRAAVMTLTVNYRSGQAILDASNAVMDLAADRFTKNLTGVRGHGERPMLVAVKDEADQARYVAEQVLVCREQGVLLRSQAVLFRTSSHSAPLELELARRNVPFVKYGGLKFLDAAHVKDVLCVLRWAHNASDRLAAFRVVRLLPGIGPATATRMLDEIERARDHAPRFTAPRCLLHQRSTGPVSWSCSNACARRIALGRAKSTTCSRGTRPISSASTRTRRRARSISPRSGESPRRSRRVSASSPRSRSIRRRPRREWRSRRTSTTTISCCRPSIPRRARSGRAFTS